MKPFFTTEEEYHEHVEACVMPCPECQALHAYINSLVGAKVAKRCERLRAENERLRSLLALQTAEVNASNDRNIDRMGRIQVLKGALSLAENTLMFVHNADVPFSEILVRVANEGRRIRAVLNATEKEE